MVMNVSDGVDYPGVECQPVHHCKQPYYHFNICSQSVSPAQSSESQTNLPIQLPSRVGDNGADGPGNHPHLTHSSPHNRQSSQEAILCVLDPGRHNVTPSTLTCNITTVTLTLSVQYNSITHQLSTLRTFTFTIINRVK